MSYKTYHFRCSIRQVPQRPQTVLHQSVALMTQIHAHSLHTSSLNYGWFVTPLPILWVIKLNTFVAALDKFLVHSVHRQFCTSLLLWQPRFMPIACIPPASTMASLLHTCPFYELQNLPLSLQHQTSSSASTDSSAPVCCSDDPDSCP